MRSVRCGCSRTRSHSPAVSGAGLSQMLLDTPSRPKPATKPGATQHLHVAGGQPELDPRPGGEVSERRRVPERVRRLEVDEASDRGERLVAPLRRQPHRQCRLPVDHRVPRIELVDAVEDLVDVASETPHEVGIELLGRSAFGHLDGGVGPAVAMRHLDELGQLDDAGRDRDRRAGEVPRPAVAVPTLVGRRRGRRGSIGGSPSSRPRARAINAWLAIMPSSSLWPETAKSTATRSRCSGVLPAPSMRSVRARSASVDDSCSYFTDFAAMSSPNQWACS